MPAFCKISLLLFLICFSIIDIPFAQDSLTEFLPDSVDGWMAAEAPRIYNRENLFDYIDGGAELYLAYDFRQLAVQTYLPEKNDSAENKSIIAEIWQMNSPADAYGVYSLDQEEKSVDLGQEGVYGHGLLRFWKDKYFVRILGLEDNLKEIILELGSKIDERIKKEGKLPELVSQLPLDSLVPGSIHFFHKQIILRNLHFFPAQNVLRLNEETNCVLADYSAGKDSLRLLLIQYPDTRMAEEIEDSLKAIYVQERFPTDDRIFKTIEGKLLGMDSERNYLILVFEGRDRNNILWLLNLTKSSLDHASR